MTPAAVSQPRKRSIPPAVWVFIAALTVRLIVWSLFFNSPYFFPDNGDMKFYNGWALRVLHGQWTDHKAFYGLPGYPFFLAAIYAVMSFAQFKWALVAVGILQTLAEAVTSVLIYKIAQQAFSASPDEEKEGGINAARPIAVGALAAAGWIFFQPSQTFSVILMPTSWMVLTFWGVVWYILKMRRASPWHPWPWIGLLIGVVTMMVATVLFLVPLVITAIFLKLKPADGRSRLPGIAAACALFLGGLLVGVSPCALHNYLIAHEPVLLSAHSGLNFYIGNNENANGYTNIPRGLRAGQEGMLQDSILWAEKAEGRKLTRVEVSHYWSARANAYIWDHFTDWLKLMCLKFKNFWNAYQYDDLSLVTMFSEAGIITPGLRFGFVAALAIPGLFIAFRKYRRSRWVIAAVFLHMSALMPVFITERYRLAAAPGLLLIGAIGLWEFWLWLARGQWRQSALYAAGCAASVLFVALPVTDGAGLWSLDYYNTGIKATDNGIKATESGDSESATTDIEVARKDLDIAFEYVPENSEINFALGNLWLEKGERTLAKTFYLRAIMINARHSGAFNNLGAMAVEDKEWGAAAAYLQKAVAIEPGDAKAYYLLAKARVGEGDLPGADKAVKQALSMVPGQKDFQELADEIGGKLKKQ